ncbi:hypothetical protein [Aneurinibacillus uraniidurans]|uniref:hypothetical protein n=1 Tax=Aneurinibacillus uraniidurans TaxID=2966586 RepID=UPI00234A6A67|nr:hypothetical protein [Aneurinibacillus sp. B1]WCN36855.1 hypothetical protein PO771_13415 [Aneurinibacillus sp. B1]
MNLYKKACLLVISGIVLSGSLSALHTEEVHGAVVSKQSTYKITYKLPSKQKLAQILPTFSIGMSNITIANPLPVSLSEKNAYGPGDFYGSLADGSQAAHEMFYSSKAGFLVKVYQYIGILSPIYPAGTSEAEINRTIKVTDPISNEYKAAQNIRFTAMMQALIQAGYVTSEDITDANKLESCSKEFIATVLYRMFKEVRPYQGTVAPTDSKNEAVRWAVEIGLPGFTLDKSGNVHPEQMMDGTAINTIFNFTTLFLPGKKTATGWEYYQMSDVRSLTTPFLLINGKPYNEVLLNNPALESNPKIRQQITKTKTAATSALLKTITEIRQDVRNPRLTNRKK